MSGFIVLHREAADHHLFKGDSSRLGAWAWLLAKACWKPTRFDVNGKTINLERGQFCCSIRDLAEAWGWSKSTVDRFLTRLKTETMIETDSGTGRLVITICNYSKYQDVPEDGGTAAGTRGGTAAGQQRDIKEQGNKGTREPNGSHIPPYPPEKIDEPELPIDPPAKPKRAKATVSMPRPVDVSEQVWADFLAMRTKMRADVSDTVIKGFRREADRVGWSLERAISESIERNWRGFRADWVKDYDRNRNGSPSAGHRGHGNGGDSITSAIDEHHQWARSERLAREAGRPGDWDASGTGHGPVAIAAARR